VQKLFQRMTSLPFAGISPTPPSLAAFFAVPPYLSQAPCQATRLLIFMALEQLTVIIAHQTWADQAITVQNSNKEIQTALAE
jgi:hypothetical protein